MRTYGKLRELIRKQFKTIDNFAKAMNISKSAMSHKLTGASAWSQTEIEKACSLLGISMSQVVEYFFYEV